MLCWKYELVGTFANALILSLSKVLLSSCVRWVISQWSVGTFEKQMQKVVTSCFTILYVCVELIEVNQMDFF